MLLTPVLPRFEVVVGCPEAGVVANVSRRLGAEDCACEGWVEAPYAELHVRDGDRTMWSPLLQLTFDDHPDGTRVFCTFRPEPGVWTGFVFAHSVFGTLAVVGLCLAYSQWSLGQPPTAMFAVLAGALCSLALYVGALAGHRLGHDHMCMLRRELDFALGSEDPAGVAWDPTTDASLEGNCS